MKEGVVICIFGYYISSSVSCITPLPGAGTTIGKCEGRHLDEGASICGGVHVWRSYGVRRFTSLREALCFLLGLDVRGSGCARVTWVWMS